MTPQPSRDSSSLEPGKRSGGVVDLLRQWQAMSIEDNDRLEAELLDAMDEDEAMAAIQIAMKHTVPAATLRGVVEAFAQIRDLLGELHEERLTVPQVAAAWRIASDACDHLGRR